MAQRDASNTTSGDAGNLPRGSKRRTSDMNRLALTSLIAAVAVVAAACGAADVAPTDTSAPSSTVTTAGPAPVEAESKPATTTTVASTTTTTEPPSFSERDFIDDVLAFAADMNQTEVRSVAELLPQADQYRTMAAHVRESADEVSPGAAEALAEYSLAFDRFADTFDLMHQWDADGILPFGQTIDHLSPEKQEQAYSPIRGRCLGTA